jgi:hypothetical protein
MRYQTNLTPLFAFIVNTCANSLVGKVIQCGTDVPAATRDMLMNKDQLVFAFAPHASHAIVDADSIMLVPPVIFNSLNFIITVLM